jgi:N-hydroxyarylamine O-acetyltransferase
MQCCASTDVRQERELVERYLGVLQIRRREPSLEALCELVAAHLMRVPFENISKLYRNKLGQGGLPNIRTFLDGIEHCHFGGTCYSNNFHFYSLLTSLGYEAKLCGADMSNPDVHLVIMVSLAGREYLVDAGYAAPLLSPLPRDLKDDHVIALGRDRYVLKPQDGNGYSRLELLRDGAYKHGYVAKPAPRKIEEFAEVIADSFRPTALFLNAVLLTRFYRDASVVIHNRELTESRGSDCRVTVLQSRDELIGAIESYFDMPKTIVEAALAGLAELEDAWS